MCSFLNYNWHINHLLPNEIDKLLQHRTFILRFSGLILTLWHCRSVWSFIFRFLLKREKPYFYEMCRCFEISIFSVSWHVKCLTHGPCFFNPQFFVSKILLLRCTEMYSWIGIMFSFCPELEMLWAQGVNTIQNCYLLNFWSPTEYLNRYFVMESDPSLLKKYQLLFCVVWQSG